VRGRALLDRRRWILGARNAFEASVEQWHVGCLVEDCLWGDVRLKPNLQGCFAVFNTVMFYLTFIYYYDNVRL
jgi:hypothetical protein